MSYSIVCPYLLYLIVVTLKLSFDPLDSLSELSIACNTLYFIIFLNIRLFPTDLNRLFEIWSSKGSKIG